MTLKAEFELKTCSDCGSTKEPSSFYISRHKTPTARCKLCTNKRNRARIVWRRNNEPKKIRERDRTSAKRFYKRHCKEIIKKNKLVELTVKGKARKALRSAVVNGTVIKPKNCKSCKKVLKLHGHHTNYRKPLDVIWLCAPCHKKEHMK